MYRLLVISVVVAFANGAALSFVEPRIIGGKEIAIETVPFQVSVQFLQGHACGGVILSATKVLTTSSCVIDTRDSVVTIPYEIRVGSNKPKAGGQLIEVLTVDQHPKYRESYDFNAAILTTKEPIDLTGVAKAVTLAPKAPAENDFLTISGWGATDSLRPAQTLQGIQVPVINKKVCADKLEPFLGFKLPSTVFCAGGAGKTIYTLGDAGGPAVNSKKQLVGLSLFSPGKYPFNLPGFYTDINNPDIRKFIDAHM